MMRRVLSLLLAASLTLWPAPSTPQTAPSDVGGFTVEARAVVVMDYDSGRVLFAQAADDRLPMASTTKIMTAMLTLEEPDRDSYFTVDTDAIHVEGSSMGLQEGDQATLNNLVYGMLLPSGNDAAGAAAVRIAGSTAAFVERMNERAQEMGLENTHFVTPSGLDADEHYTSARDLAAITREALQNPDFRAVCSQYKAVQEYGNPPYRRWLTNHNKLLLRYDGCIGVKTGFTDNAHRCLVTAAQRGDVTLIVVTLNCLDDFNIHTALYDRYFAQLTRTDLSGQLGDLAVPVAGSQTQLPVRPIEPPAASLLPGEREKLELRLELPPFVYAPVEAGDAVGMAVFTSGGETVLECPLVAGEAAALPEHPGLLERLKRWIASHLG